MKTRSLIVIAAVIGFAGAAHAEEGERDRPHRKLPPEIMEKFDKDGDGKLNEEERKAARAARGEMMESRRKEMLAKFDKDGDGKLNDEEEAAMKEERRKRMLERFDKDKDGELSDDEKAEMRKAMTDHRGGPGMRDGKHGGGKRRHTGDKPDAPEEEAPGVTE